MKLEMSLSRKDVVVTLVCLTFLLAVLGAVGATGRRRAKEVLCLSNLRRWGSLFHVYAADHDGYFHEGYWGTPDCMANWWFKALESYYGGDDKIRCCPEAILPGSIIGRGDVGATFYAWGGSGWLGVEGYGSYGINGWVENNQCELASETIGRLRWRTPNVAGAADVPLLLDEQWIDGWPMEQQGPPAQDDQDFRLDPSTHFDRFCLNRHSGFVNSVFLDGSARKVGLKELWTLKWHRKYDTCGGWTQCGGVEPNDWPVWMRDFEDY
jgi:prepilin-type processing-associated H-X9-DG protein